MKKLILMFAAIAAVSFASCGNKQAEAEKAAAEVNLKHAQIELDATKNEHLKSHASSHILKAKNFLKKVPNKHHKK